MDRGSPRPNPRSPTVLKALLVAALVASLGACATPEPAEPECGDLCLEHDFGAVDIPAGFENADLCISWTVGNDSPIAVNEVAVSNDGYWHHSNWFWVPEERWDLPDGAWSCREHGFGELEAALYGGVLFAQSTQVLEESQTFLPGAALELPPRVRVIAAAHVLNPDSESVKSHMRVRLGLLPPSEVQTSLSLFRFNYGALSIAPGSITEHTGACDIESELGSFFPSGLDMKLHYILPHFHGLGDGFRLEILGGPEDGEVLYDLDDAWGHAFGRTFETPIDLGARGANGLRLTCRHENPRDVTVGFGIGDQEMCVALGFVDAPIKFDAAVNETTEEYVEDGIVQRSGHCNILGFPR